MEIFGNGYFYVGKKLNRDKAEMVTYGDNTMHQFISSKAIGKFNYMYGKLGFSYQFLGNHSIGAYYRIGQEKSDTHAMGLSNVNLYTHVGIDFLR